LAPGKRRSTVHGPNLQEGIRSGGSSEEDGQQLLSRLLQNREAAFCGRGKYKVPCPPDTSGLANLPAGWVWASPGQLSAASSYSLGIGPFGSDLKVSDYRGIGVPLVFVRNIRAGDFTLLTKFVSEDKADKLCAHTADGGDILVTKMGDPPGDVSLYPLGSPRAVITADCIRWRTAPELDVPKFFVYAIRSKAVQSQILGRTRGVAQKKISLERFRDLAVPLPPLAEQRKIVAEIEKQFTRLEAGVAALKRAQGNLKRYRASVLKAACEGRLVPTEAELARQEGRTYEPACELLARILRAHVLAPCAFRKTMHHPDARSRKRVNGGLFRCRTIFWSGSTRSRTKRAEFVFSGLAPKRPSKHGTVTERSSVSTLAGINFSTLTFLIVPHRLL
jgi:type I restriction enzyme S subunit